MHTLTLMEQVLTLGIEADLFTVERGGERIDTLRTAEIDEVLIFGQISVSPAAIHLMLSKSMAVVFLSARGQYRGRLLGHSGKNIELRLRQFDRMRDDQFALGWARAVAAGKIANQRGLLLRNQREHQRDDLAGAIASMRRLLTSVAEAENRETLRGLEGQAAALYFGALGKCLRNPAFAFARRSRRPPLDPPNAILSFGYVLLGSAMESLILRVGLEPLLGAFHSPEYGRPSLALDLIEEFRAPVVDALMLRLINKREVTAEDFESVHADANDDGEAQTFEDGGAGETPARATGVWLGETGRRVFFRAWGRRLRETIFYEPRGQVLSLEQIMEQQVHHLARCIRGEDGFYQPFVPR